MPRKLEKGYALKAYPVKAATHKRAIKAAAGDFPAWLDAALLRALGDKPKGKTIAQVVKETKGKTRKAPNVDLIVKTRKNGKQLAIPIPRVRKPKRKPDPATGAAIVG